jgi:hypothetical protein
VRDQGGLLPAAAGEIDLLDRLDEGVHGADGTPPCLLETAAGKPCAPELGEVRPRPSD